MAEEKDGTEIPIEQDATPGDKSLGLTLDLRHLIIIMLIMCYGLDPSTLFL